MAPKAEPSGELEALRGAIDTLNGELLALLCRRGELVQRIGLLSARGKAPAGKDPEREEAMLAAVLRANPGPYTRSDLTHIFHAIFDCSLALKRQGSKDAP